jgi:hypothetical protein
MSDKERAVESLQKLRRARENGRTNDVSGAAGEVFRSFKKLSGAEILDIVDGTKSAQPPTDGTNLNSPLRGDRNADAEWEAACEAFGELCQLTDMEAPLDERLRAEAEVFDAFKKLRTGSSIYALVSRVAEERAQFLLEVGDVKQRPPQTKISPDSELIDEWREWADDILSSLPNLEPNEFLAPVFSPDGCFLDGIEVHHDGGRSDRHVTAEIRFKVSGSQYNPKYAIAAMLADAHAKLERTTAYLSHVLHIFKERAKIDDEYYLE